MHFVTSCLLRWAHGEYGGAQRVLLHFFHYTLPESMEKHATRNLRLVHAFLTSQYHPTLPLSAHSSETPWALQAYSRHQLSSS